ncbi:CueP family metal-binding protein [Mycoplasmatota bacterium]|nr:CueP family metal-binding protein [Mycoplasmatota bacterium]
MKKLLLIMLFPSLLILVGCTNNLQEYTLKELGLAGMSGKEILMSVADKSIDSSRFNLSVYDDELIVISGKDKISVDMPKDEFYLSVAPYINSTHKCLYHSATSCKGELANEIFHIEFINDDGNIILNEDYQSLDNGFIDLWLPRNIKGTITITYGELSSTKTISTYSGEPTCETTMRLI